MNFYREYLACLEKWESKGNLEIRELSENQAEMDKMEPVDPKETLVNLVLKVCQEDRVEMVQLVSLDLQVPWWKVKRF